MTNSARRWTLVLCYLVLMYVSTAIISIWGILDNQRAAQAVFLAVYILAGIALIAIGLRRFGIKNDYAWLYLGIIVALLLLACQNLSEARDRLHFLEYGLLWVLVYRAVKESANRFTAYGIALIATCCFGIIDELFQSMYPHGFFDLSDVMNNTFAGYLAAGVILVWERC